VRAVPRWKRLSSLAGSMLDSRHALRFLFRSRTASVYPVTFNEPLSWVTDPGAAAGKAALSRACLAIPWDAGGPRGRVAGMRLVTSERIVEMPFTHRALVAAGINPPARVLEFGCAHSRLALELCSLGYGVTAVDLNPYPFTHPNLRFVRGNLLQIDLEDWPYDAATAISVIEHAGLEAGAGYSATSQAPDDTALLNRLHALLRPGGLLVLTVPFGRAAVTTEYRIYDEAGLTRLTRGWTVLSNAYARRDGSGHWLPADAASMATLDSSIGAGRVHFPVSGVAMLALIR